MNCEHVIDNLAGLISGSLSPTQLAECRQHLAGCPACSDALHGAEALALLRAREGGDAPPGLFDRILAGLDPAQQAPRTGRRFWLGTAFGGALAASLFALAFALGWIATPTPAPTDVAEFAVAVGERHNMDLAIETDRPLDGATISILLAGGVELAGYGSRRELTWTSDLKAGTNRLSLPVVALGEDGGRVVVRVSHPHSEQVFVVRLRTSA
jgi:hypothetical protein